MKVDQLLMLVVAFLLGYFAQTMCSGVVEGLICDGRGCGLDKRIGDGSPNQPCAHSPFTDKDMCPACRGVAGTIPYVARPTPAGKKAKDVDQKCECPEGTVDAGGGCRLNY